MVKMKNMKYWDPQKLIFLLYESLLTIQLIHIWLIYSYCNAS